MSRALREGYPAAHPPAGEISISRTRGRLSCSPHESFTYQISVIVLCGIRTQTRACYIVLTRRK